MIRQFTLIKKDDYGLTDVSTFSLSNKGVSFINNPSGLGSKFDTNYTRIDTAWVQSYQRPSQMTISGEMIFSSYATYHSFGAFVGDGTSLTLRYTNDNGTYDRDVTLTQLDMSEIGTGNVLHCNVTFACLGLWYKDKSYDLTIGKAWNTNRVTITNTGQTEAGWVLKSNTASRSVSDTIALTRYMIWSESSGMSYSERYNTEWAFTSGDNLNGIYIDARKGKETYKYNGSSSKVTIDFREDNFTYIPMSADASNITIEFYSEDLASDVSGFNFYVREEYYYV